MHRCFSVNDRVPVPARYHLEGTLRRLGLRVTLRLGRWHAWMRAVPGLRELCACLMQITVRLVAEVISKPQRFGILAQT
jgi:hypothetical protein